MLEIKNTENLINNNFVSDNVFVNSEAKINTLLANNNKENEYLISNGSNKDEDFPEDLDNNNFKSEENEILKDQKYELI